MSREITVAQPTELAHAVTPMSLIEQASARGASIEQMQQLFELQLRWEADFARKAFVSAMAEFKKEKIIILRDKDNLQYKSKYASIGNLVNTVTPFLSKHGLSASWTPDQKDGISITCTITHALGHSESKTINVPLDTSGAKNPLQQIKSSMTYARILSFECACGLASTEGNLDDDGNASGISAKTGMPEDEFASWLANIENAASGDDLKKYFNAAYGEAQKIADKGAMKQFSAARDARRKELGV